MKGTRRHQRARARRFLLALESRGIRSNRPINWELGSLPGRVVFPTPLVDVDVYVTCLYSSDPMDRYPWDRRL